MKKGILYIVATPIGNLTDISLRAIEILKTVHLIAAEDTRHSRFLLEHYGIATKAISLHQYNEAMRLEFLLKKLEQGETIALISDAGTPLISDPGYPLVSAVWKAGFQVIPIPGACAAISALVASGLPTDRFIFEGFLSAKSQARSKRLQELLYETRTIIFYESTHRILDFLDDLIKVFGPDRFGVIARELTKTFETIYRGNLPELKQLLTRDVHQQKGEFVVLIKGVEVGDEEKIFAEHKRILQLLLAQLPLKQAVDITMQITQSPRKPIYQMALTLKKDYN